MSKITTSTGWMTSFIYEQDLSSYYMNNILSSIIRPGIFNANISVAVADNNLHLLIKKGTTFVFTNDYISGNELGFSGFRRNMSNVNNRTFNNPEGFADRLAIIKCTALRDIDQVIAAGDNGNASLLLENSTLFIHAYMGFDPKTTSAAKYKEIPTFFVSVKNTELSNNYIFKTNSIYIQPGTEMAADAKSNYLIPDGATEYTPTLGDLYHQYFLMVGALIKKPDSTTFERLDDSWLKNFVFTARGVPEYRYSMTPDNSSIFADIIPNMLPIQIGETTKGIGAGIFVDLPGSIINNNYYEDRLNDIKQDYTWEDCYYNTGLDISSKLTNINFTITSEAELSEGENVIIDFVYMTLKNNLTNLPEDFSITDVPVYKNIRHVIKNTDFYETLNYLKKTSNVWSSGNYNTIIPLDICSINVQRLCKLIKNNNLISILINKIRENQLANSEDATSIVPLALYFRGINKNTKEWVCPFSDEETINPENALSFLDLSRKMAKVNVFDISDNNTYNIIPVIN